MEGDALRRGKHLRMAAVREQCQPGGLDDEAVALRTQESLVATARRCHAGYAQEFAVGQLCEINLLRRVDAFFLRKGVDRLTPMVPAVS